MMPSSDFSKAGNLEYSMILFSFLNANVDSDNFFKICRSTKTPRPHIYIFCLRGYSIVLEKWRKINGKNYSNVPSGPLASRVEKSETKFHER